SRMVRCMSHLRWLQFLRPTRRHGLRKRSQPPGRVLVFETLEDRCLPSTVTNLDDAGAGSLRQALLDTPAGGTVDFQPGLTGTITLTTGELAIGRNMTIAGPGADVITVSGNHRSRVFNTSATVTISGLTITDGESSAPGGGVRNTGTLTIADSVVTGNAVHQIGDYSSGGGIYNDGTLTVSDSLVIGNTVTVTNPSGYAHGYGGGISSGFGPRVTITNSVIRGNTATTNAPLVSNTYSSGGGFFRRNAVVTVTDSTFSDNVSEGNSGAFGGGIDTYDETVTITNSTIFGNRLIAGDNGAGGGILSQGGGGAITVTNSTISGNTIASARIGEGAGIHAANGLRLTLTSCTVSGNSTSGPGGGAVYGGGILVYKASVAARNTIVAGNSAPTSPDVGGALNSQGHNLIGDGTGGSGYHPTDLVGTPQNPIDARLDSLEDN